MVGGYVCVVEPAFSNALGLRSELSCWRLAAGGVGAWDADLDLTFHVSGRNSFPIVSDGTAYAVAVQPDGKIVLAGTTVAGGSRTDHDFAFARLLPDGELDVTFNLDGKANFDPSGTWTEDYIYDIAIQPDGKIVAVGGTVTGASLIMQVVRLTADGGVDGWRQVPFPENAWAHGVALQPDGKIVVSGKTYYPNTGADFAVARLNSDLTMDTTFSSNGMADWDFGDGGYDCAYDVAIRGDGKIVLAGTAYRFGQSVFGIMVFSTTGGPQYLGLATFPAAAYGEGLALQADGKAVVCGKCDTNGGDFAVARFSTNATLDTTFDFDGMATFSHSDVAEEFARDVVIQHDGRIVVVGHLVEDGFEKLALSRWNADGAIDHTFNISPLYSYTYVGFRADQDARGRGIALQPDGKLVVGGWTGFAFGGPFAAVARFKGDEDLIFADDFESRDTAWWGDWGP